VAEEERERQEAEAAERERVAEEIRKLEEEERQRWEAEHCAEPVHQVQAPESPMWVDDGSGDDRDAEEEMKKKGKGKEKDGWEIIGGSGRCKVCQKEETACKINLGEIEKWRKSTEKGKVYKKAPPATSCQRCMEVRQKPCILPATEECQRKMEKPGKPLANEAVSSAFRQFGREEAFGGRGLRASAQEETEEGGRKNVDGRGILDGGCRYAGVDCSRYRPLRQGSRVAELPAAATGGGTRGERDCVR